MSERNNGLNTTAYYICKGENRCTPSHDTASSLSVCVPFPINGFWFFFHWFTTHSEVSTLPGCAWTPVPTNQHIARLQSLLHQYLSHLLTTTMPISCHFRSKITRGRFNPLTPLCSLCSTCINSWSAGNVENYIPPAVFAYARWVFRTIDDTNEIDDWPIGINQSNRTDISPKYSAGCLCCVTS